MHAQVSEEVEQALRIIVEAAAADCELRVGGISRVSTLAN